MPTIKFIAYVNLLDALCKENFLLRDPAERNNILVLRNDFPDNCWVSENIFTLAQDLFDSKEQRESLFGTLKEYGKIPIFTKAGDFERLCSIERGQN